MSGAAMAVASREAIRAAFELRGLDNQVIGVSYTGSGI